MSKNIELRMLPIIKGTLTDYEAYEPFDSFENLLRHESMQVYFDTKFNDADYCLSELDTTLARAELLRPLFDQLFKDYGPEASVLDLACSPGYFMFKMAQAGFENIHGVDARPEHKAHFEFLKSKYNYSQLSFELSDVYEFLEKEITLGKQYDICLLFGFLYHTSTPIELLRNIKKICKKCLIVDTTLSLKDDVSLLIYEEPVEWSRASTEKISFIPSLRSIPKLFEAAGFTHQERVYPDKRYEVLNPGGDNIDYYFDQNNLIKSSKCWKTLNACGAKFGLWRKKVKSRRAFFCVYP